MTSEQTELCVNQTRLIMFEALRISQHPQKPETSQDFISGLYSMAEGVRQAE